MTPLELSQIVKSLQERTRVLEAEVTALRSRVGELESNPVVETVITNVPQEPKRKLCPKCGKKPAYFFHTKSCRGP